MAFLIAPRRNSLAMYDPAMLSALLHDAVNEPDPSVRLTVIGSLLQALIQAMTRFISESVKAEITTPAP